MPAQKRLLWLNIKLYGAWLAGVCIGGAGLWLLLSFLEPQPTDPLVDSAHSTAQLVLDAAAPERLIIPSIALNTTFTESVGVDSAGAIAVPATYSEVALYQYGPTPGQPGPAVVVGHVDSIRGPAVLYNLKKVSVGDEVFVERADGITAVFTVTEVEDLQQSRFPTEKVYGDLDHAGLRLITCTGTFNHAEQVYSHNLIVYAELIRQE